MEQQTTPCPRCGEPVTGRFCTRCGAALQGIASRSRSLPLGPTLAGGALLLLIAFVLGNAVGRGSSPGAGAAADVSDVKVPLGAMQAGQPAGGATDISSMTPDERANRLFNRVMSYSEQGKTDSARFFAPMAIQAYEMMGPPDLHVRYDIGVISAAAGDVGLARAEADTILKARPTHLLGLALAIRAANLANDPAAAARFGKRLIAAAPAERASGLKEYAEHARDVDDALAKAAPKR